MLGLIDVPGHEKLVHTMAAGASGIDFALLVIAADDGVMPQTREHLAILELLGVTRGAIALTKIDRVDAGRLKEVREEIEAWLATSILQDAPLFDTNATRDDDAGVAALDAHLREAAARWRMRRDDGLFRLAVDRVFTLERAGHDRHGHGVRGTRERRRHDAARAGGQTRARAQHPRAESRDARRAARASVAR